MLIDLIGRIKINDIIFINDSVIYFLQQQCFGFYGEAFPTFDSTRIALALTKIKKESDFVICVNILSILCPLCFTSFAPFFTEFIPD